MSIDKTFVNAMCISRQKYLLGKDKLARLMEAASFEEAYHMLGEMGFGEGNADPALYQQMLVAEQAKLHDFVRAYAPTEAIKAYCLAPRDFYNAEYAVRQQYLSLPDPSPVDGTISFERIRKGVSGAYNVLPPWLVAPIKQASALFERGEATGVAVSTIFLRAQYEYLLSECRRAPMRRYVQWQIDTKNISVALRASTRSELESMWIEGGQLSFDTLLLLQKGDRTAVNRRFMQTDYTQAVHAAVEAKEQQQPLIAYENAVDSAFLRSLYPHRYDSEGVAPFLLYFGYRTNDIANVRIVLAAKAAGADKESIKSRLRVSYGE